MIEITFTHSLKSDAPTTDIINIIEVKLLDVYDEMHARLKPLISQSVILNCCVNIINENNQIVMSHFATTPDNAQIFLNEYPNAVAWWEPHGIEFKIDQKEIDFDTVDIASMTMVIDNNDILYGLKNPRSAISSPSAALSKQVDNKR